MGLSPIGKKVRHGAIWLTIGQMSGYALTFVSSIVLARLLFPDDYGLRAMAITVSNLVHVIGSVGTNEMLIQQQEDFNKYANAGFRLNIVIGICLFIIQVSAAPFAGSFYGNPMVTQLIMVSAIVYLIGPFGSIQRTILIKKMEFKKSTIVEITRAILTSLLSILFAVNGMGVWSFIIPPILASVIQVGQLWLMESWRPTKGPTLEYWRHIFRYGKNILGSNLLWYIENNIDYFLIGKFVGTKALGMYYFAFEKSFGLISKVQTISGTLSFSAFSQIKVDPIRFKAGFFKSASFLSLITLPFIFLLAGIGPEFILFLFGAKWSAAIIPFFFLTLSTVFRPIGSLSFQLINAAGRPDISFKYKLLTTPINIVSILIGLQFGIIGVSVATVIYRSITIPVFVYICMRTLKWEFKALMKAVSPALFCGILMFFLIGLIRTTALNSMNLPLVSRLVILSITGIAFYLAALRLLYRDKFQELCTQVVMFLPQPLRARFSS